MIDRKAAITTIILIAATFIGSVWSFAHVYATHPEAISSVWFIFRHVAGPSWGIVCWLLMWRSVRKFPNPNALESPLKTYYGFMLVSCCAVIALIQALMVAREFGLQVPIHNMHKLPLVLMGLIFLVIGNAQGKLPSPYKGGYAEPVSWDKMNRFTGWVFVVYGFAMLAGALTLPDHAILPSLAVSWIVGMSLLLAKRHQLKRHKRREMS